MSTRSDSSQTGSGPMQAAIAQNNRSSSHSTTAPSPSRPEVQSTEPGPNASRKREKPQLSCNLCRRRKLRCDRQKPCSSCSSRGLACTYADNQATPRSLRKPAVMHDRILQLERLVLSLVPNSTVSSISGRGSVQPPPVSPKPSSGHSAAASFPSPDVGSMGSTLISPDETAPSASELRGVVDAQSECGSMRVSSAELSYVGGDHWAAILDGIADIKEHFKKEQALEGENGHELLHNRPRHALLLYGCRLPVSNAEILAALPPRSTVDRYISRYFNRLDLVHSIVHGPGFLREYDKFWADPSSAPMVWVGLLFSMICLALLASDASETAHDDPEHLSLQVDLYREKTVQCLVLGEYTKSGPHVLETVIHYVYIELCIRDDADKDIWFLFSLEVSLAMRMGYHRDPRHFPGISPLQAEMRRRLWATVLQGDILISTQMGMPRLISDSRWDTAEPRNLTDANLDCNTAELPASRPETEVTPALGIIARRRMFLALGAVADLTSAIQPHSYADVLDVDRILHDAVASIPPILKAKPMATSVTDPPELIMARLFLEHLFYLGQIMLHRRFLFLTSTSPSEKGFEYSRNAALEASLGALRIQHTLDEETRPGGQLHMMRWRISSIMNHTFLTATMVLCSMLYRGQTLQRDDEIYKALRTARSIWLRATVSSHEAKKAAETVSIIIARQHKDCAAQQNKSGNDMFQDSTSIYRNRGPDEQHQSPSYGTTLDNSCFDARPVDPVASRDFVACDGQEADINLAALLDIHMTDVSMTLDEWAQSHSTSAMGYW